MFILHRALHDSGAFHSRDFYHFRRDLGRMFFVGVTQGRGCRWGKDFWKPTATGTFYPDLFAELNDGRVLLVEYKDEHLVEHEQQKKNIGERWAETSGGKALFLWAVKKDEHGRDVHRQLQDKLAKS
ncbi:MAG: hypothetical protein NT154_03420 [Verrucomicrobia bacterium]|nr:hypothetical protein [Verrucomicrobiota bacterium]